MQFSYHTKKTKVNLKIESFRLNIFFGIVIAYEGKLRLNIGTDYVYIKIQTWLGLI